MVDFNALDRAPLQRDPCDFVVVPEFVRPDAFAAISRDYPAIIEAGNFPPESLTFGPAFQALLDELNGPEVRERFGAKFGMDLTPYPLQLTVRKYCDASDGNIHNDSKSKHLTVLIYFNDEWDAPGGQLRILRTPKNIDDYIVEVPPVRGTLLAFRRNEKSFHGFPVYVGERRSIQFYWVTPKRAARTEPKSGPRIWLKRLLKVRPR